MFGNENDSENVFEFLHCRHKNIKFAIEKENNKIAYHIYWTSFSCYKKEIKTYL